MLPAAPLITNDAVILGLLALTLGGIFYSTQLTSPFWKKLHAYVPALLWCYFIPGVFNSIGLIDGENSQLYFVSSRYLLPAALILLTLSIDLPAVMRLGPIAIMMFLTGTIGIVLGGPLALLVIGAVSPETIGGASSGDVWRGLATLAGSWIGGGANMTAMKEVFEVGDSLFSQMVVVDVIWANIWMAVLLLLAGRSAAIDARTGADTSAITDLRERVEAFQKRHARIMSFNELIFILAIGLGGMGLAHLIAEPLANWIGANLPLLKRYSLTSTFFWIVVFATTLGLLLSFTPARRLEGAGASKIGSGFLYILIVSIGMHMDIPAIFDNPGLFAIGGIWMSFHAGLLLLVAKLLKAPVFFMAVGSQANVGGAATAPVVAAAFHPSLAPVGVLLAVLGYALGTYAAWFCGQLMRVAAGG